MSRLQLSLLACILWGPAPAWARTYQVLMGGATTPLVTGGAVFAPLDSLRSDNATENTRRSLAGAAGDLTHFAVQVLTAPGGSTTWTVTVREDAANTVLSCTISGTATSCTDEDVEAIAAASELTVSITPSATDPAATTWMTWSAVFIPTTHGETRYGGGGGALSATVTNYISLMNQAVNATENLAQSIVAVPGTFKNFYVDLSGDPDNGVGTQSYAFTLRNNGAACGTITCTVSQGSTTCSDTTNSCAAVAGDLLSVSSVPANTPTARNVAIGIGFTPTTEGQFMFSFLEGGTASLSASSTVFAFPNTATESWGATETNVQMLAPAMTVTGYYVNLTAGPNNGAGTQTYDFTLRDDVANTGQTCQVSEDATTCSLTTSVDIIGVNSLLAHQAVPGNTPLATMQSRIGIGAFLPPRRIW